MDSMNIRMQRKSLKCLYKQIIIIIILVLFYLLELNKNRSDLIMGIRLDESDRFMSVKQTMQDKLCAQFKCLGLKWDKKQ